MRLRLLALASISALVLVGCGVRGNLKTPPPIWGDKDKAPQEQTEPTSTEPADIEDNEDDNYLEGPY